MSVNLSELLGTLAGTSQVAALAGATLSIVDQELLSYETATLTTAYNYNVTGLARAQGGSLGVAHNSGAPFARLDGAIQRYDLPANFIGQVLYLKFQSFNVFGQGTQDLSTCEVYTFQPMYQSTVAMTTPSPSTTPTLPTDPIAVQLLSGFALNLGSVNGTVTLADNFGSVTGSVGDVINLGAVAPTMSDPIYSQIYAQVGGGSPPYGPISFGLVTSYPTLSDNFGSVVDAVSSPALVLGIVP